MMRISLKEALEKARSAVWQDDAAKIGAFLSDLDSETAEAILTDASVRIGAAVASEDAKKALDKKAGLLGLKSPSKSGKTTFDLIVDFWEDIPRFHSA